MAATVPDTPAEIIGSSMDVRASFEIRLETVGGDGN
jgi:hypothetical protein